MCQHIRRSILSEQTLVSAASSYNPRSALFSIMIFAIQFDEIYGILSSRSRPSVIIILANSYYINPLMTKRKLLYLKTQFVPRSKHFISVIKTNQFML